MTKYSSLAARTSAVLGICGEHPKEPITLGLRDLLYMTPEQQLQRLFVLGRSQTYNVLLLGTEAPSALPEVSPFEEFPYAVLHRDPTDEELEQLTSEGLPVTHQVVDLLRRTHETDEALVFRTIGRSQEYVNTVD